MFKRMLPNKFASVLALVVAVIFNELYSEEISNFFLRYVFLIVILGNSILFISYFKLEKQYVKPGSVIGNLFKVVGYFNLFMYCLNFIVPELIKLDNHIVPVYVDASLINSLFLIVLGHVYEYREAIKQSGFFRKGN